MAARLYGILWRWHFIAGLVTAPIIFVIAVTGVAYTFAPEGSLWLDARPRITARDTTVSLDAVLATASRTCTPSAMMVPSDPAIAITVACADGERHHVLVDPYRDALIAERDGKTFFDVMLELHWELLAGDWGRRAIEWATSWAVLLLVSGAALWWPRGKRTVAGVWTVRTRGKSRERLRDLHAVIGIYALPIIFLSAATGLMWTLHAGDQRWAKIAHADLATPRSTPQATPRIGIDRALAMTGPRAGRAVYFTLPTADDQPYTFLLFDDNQVQQWRTETWFVDAYTPRVLQHTGWADHGTLARLDTLAYSLHTGSILGLPGRICAALAAFVLAGLAATGPWMWWKRRPRGGLGMPPRARRQPWSLLVIVAVASWVLPLVGYSVLIVIALELVLNVRRGLDVDR